MIFSNRQIEEVLKIIDFQHTLFVVGNISSNVLSESDLLILKSFGIDINDFKNILTPFQQAFYFGRLAAALRDQTTKIDYIDFKKYIERGQYNPLSNREKKTLQYLEENTYNFITKQRENIKSQIQNELNSTNIRDTFGELVSEELKTGLKERRTIKEVISSIGSKTQKWNSDLGRIVETETQNAYLYGKGLDIVEKYGAENVKFFKHVYPLACKYCIAAYLTNGMGSEPRLFTMQQLLNNGTNIGLKAKDWKPVLGSTHNFCRCDLDYISTMEEWDSENKEFKLKEKYSKEAREIKGKIIVKVGDKTFDI